MRSHRQVGSSAKRSAIRTSYLFSHGGKKCVEVVRSSLDYFLHDKFRTLREYGLAPPYGGTWPEDKTSNMRIQVTH